MRMAPARSDSWRGNAGLRVARRAAEAYGLLGEGAKPFTGHSCSGWGFWSVDQVTRLCEAA